MSTAPIPTAVWRVHSERHGPLNPRLASPPVTREWGRFDVAGWATVYAAGSRLGAFLETLGHYRPDPRLSTTGLAELFGETPPSIESQWNPTVAEGEAQVGVPPGTLHPDWRLARQIACIRTRSPGRLIDLDTADTLGYLRSKGDEWIPRGHPLRATPAELDLSHLTGSDRSLTTALATWLAATALPDGALPAGVRFVSRHGADLFCYAIWIDMERFPPDSDVPEAVATQMTATCEDIRPSDRDLRKAAAHLNLKVL